ncbi:MAG TPA: hypothetical protein VK548_17460 [Candidatus Acidoferrum sp.]|nr:hypothetical protein [Candidatus Acidoferrum sp.]
MRDALERADVEVERVARPEPDASDDPYRLQALLAALTPAPDGLLLLAPRRRPPGRLTPAPVLNRIPVGIVQADSPRQLAPWLAALRADAGLPPTPTWGALAMGKDVFLELGRSCIRSMRTGGAPHAMSVGNWLADTISRDSLCANLAAGPRLAVYIGHGRPLGWSGYQAVRWRHVEKIACQRPCGIVVAFACDTLNGLRGMTPFGCRWVYQGRACSYLGVTSGLDVAAGCRLMEEFGALLATGNHQTIGQLLVALDEQIGRREDLAPVRPAFSMFRLIGNPLQTLF